MSNPGQMSMRDKQVKSGTVPHNPGRLVASLKGFRPLMSILLL